MESTEATALNLASLTCSKVADDLAFWTSLGLPITDDFLTRHYDGQDDWMVRSPLLLASALHSSAQRAWEIVTREIGHVRADLLIEELRQRGSDLFDAMRAAEAQEVPSVSRETVEQRIRECVIKHRVRRVDVITTACVAAWFDHEPDRGVPPSVEKLDGSDFDAIDRVCDDSRTPYPLLVKTGRNPLLVRLHPKFRAEVSEALRAESTRT